MEGLSHRQYLYRRRRLIAGLFAGLLLLWPLTFAFETLLAQKFVGAIRVPVQQYESKQQKLQESELRKVPLEAHIMSKCPDARDCLRDLVVPAMVQAVDIVDFQLSFIGETLDLQVVDRIDPKDGTSVHCKHGPSECLGNQLALCAQSLYRDEPKISLGFATCMISSYRDIPQQDLVRSCAWEHGVDFEKLNECVSEDGSGEELLRASVLHSQEEGVKYSCTVRLSDRIWCIRDSGKWKNCPGGSSPDELVREIQQAYQELNKNLD